MSVHTAGSPPHVHFKTALLRAEQRLEEQALVIADLTQRWVNMQQTTTTTATTKRDGVRRKKGSRGVQELGVGFQPRQPADIRSIGLETRASPNGLETRASTNGLETRASTNGLGTRASPAKRAGDDDEEVQLVVEEEEVEEEEEEEHDEDVALCLGSIPHGGAPPGTPSGATHDNNTTAAAVVAAASSAVAVAALDVIDDSDAVDRVTLDRDDDASEADDAAANAATSVGADAIAAMGTVAAIGTMGAIKTTIETLTTTEALTMDATDVDEEATHSMEGRGLHAVMIDLIELIDDDGDLSRTTEAAAVAIATAKSAIYGPRRAHLCRVNDNDDDGNDNGSGGGNDNGNGGSVAGGGSSHSDKDSINHGAYVDYTEVYSAKNSPFNSGLNSPQRSPPRQVTQRGNLKSNSNRHHSTITTTTSATTTTTTTTNNNNNNNNNNHHNHDHNHVESSFASINPLHLPPSSSTSPYRGSRMPAYTILPPRLFNTSIDSNGTGFGFFPGNGLPLDYSDKQGKRTPYRATYSTPF